ncbi:MAG: carbohydrate-binding domain-containing protein [Bacteroidia bacterium]|nr:carbohydrate-binding domain-containing protein [Bacteroidia bacterium]
MTTKMIPFRFLYLVLISMVTLNACEISEPNSENDSTDINNDISGVNNDDDFVENSNFSYTVSINYNNDNVSIVNPLEGNGVTITQNGCDIIVISSVKEVEYALFGQAIGSFKLYSDYKCKLSLNGVSLTHNTGAAINIQCKKTTFVVVSEQNFLTDASGYSTSIDEEDQKACFFSEGQLVFSGDGDLTINANNNHALASDDYIRVRSGSLIIMGNSADGIHTNDALIVDGGIIGIRSKDDGIVCDEGYIYINGGDLSINTTGTSAKGIKAMGQIIINDGKILVNTTASESEGIESKGNMTINGGTIEVCAYDDCINVGLSTSSLTINGGYIYCKSTTNDGIDSNGTLTIAGGVVVSIGAKAPEEGFDCDQNTFAITGGTFIGMGGGTSNPSQGACTQYSVSFNGTQSTNLNLSLADGTQILNASIPSLGYSPLILCSSPNMVSGSCIIKIGGSISGGTEWHGLYLNAEYSGGVESGNATASLGSNQTSSGPGGMNPGGR